MRFSGRKHTELTKEKLAFRSKERRIRDGFINSPKARQKVSNFLLRPDNEVFIENSKIARHSVKNRIIKRNLIPYICAICNIGPEWNNKSMPLILDHKNGINNDNRLENLRFVCSNCDSQLDTYKSRNKGRESRAASVTALKADGIHPGMAIDTTSLPPNTLEIFFKRNLNEN